MVDRFLRSRIHRANGFAAWAAACGLGLAAAFPAGGFVVVSPSDGWFRTDTGSVSNQPSVQRLRYQAATPVPAPSPSMRFALGVALLLGAGFALRVKAREGDRMAHRRHRWWLAGFLLAAALPLSSQARVYQTSAVVLEGDSLPFAGGPAAAGGILPGFYASTAGKIAFTAFPEGAPLEQSVFRATGGNIEAIASPGDPAPGTGGAVFGYLFGLGVDADGDVLFYANDCAGPCYEGLFLSTPTGVVPVVLTGEAAPGTGGGSFSGLDFGSAAFDGAGGVAFEASVSGGSTGGGVFLASGGQIAPIALEGDAAPGGAGDSFFGFLGRVGVNAAGRVVFSALLDASNGPSGVFLHEPGGLRAVALTGEPAPGGGTFSNFANDTWIDASGDVVFSASVVGAANAGIFQDSDGSLRAVARAGQPAPGVGGVFHEVLDPAQRGAEVAFIGTVEDPLAVGLFSERDGTLELVTRSGVSAPGTGGSFHSVGVPRPGPPGALFFYGVVADGESGGGIFRAREVPAVPALGGAGLGVVAAALAGSALVRFRRRLPRP